MASQVPWSRILAEGVVIVASILLALAADAAWDARQARSAEGSYLEAMLADVDGVFGAAAATLEAHARLDEESRKRIEAIRAGGEVPDSLFLQTRQSHGAALALRGSLDAYEDLVMSGGVTTVRDPAVRIAMARLASAIELQRQHVVVVLDGTSETNLELTSAAVSRPQELSARIVLAEENGQMMRGFNSNLVTNVRDLASEARATLVAAIARRP